MRREIHCIELVEVVTEWMEDALGEHDRVLVQAHLATCASCATYVAQLRMVPTLLRRQPTDRPPDPVRAALLEAVRRAR